MWKRGKPSFQGLQYDRANYLNSGLWQRIHCSNCSSPFCISDDLLFGLVLFITVVHLTVESCLDFFFSLLFLCLLGNQNWYFIFVLNAKLWTYSGLYFFSLPSEQKSSDNNVLTRLISSIFNHRHSCFLDNLFWFKQNWKINSCGLNPI